MAQLFLAEVAELAGRFDDMAQEMKRFIDVAKPLTLSQTERNLLSVAYKNSVASRRAASRSMKRIIEEAQAAAGKEGSTEKVCHKQVDASLRVLYAQEYGDQIAEETRGICIDILEILHQLLENANSSEDIVFYQKMQADYYRHLAECHEGDVQSRMLERARWSYCQAEVLAERDLDLCHPMRLAVALNYSVFIAEVDLDERAARLKARKTFHAALEVLDDIPEAW